MSAARDKKRAARAKKKAAKLAAMQRPGFKSKYALKDRPGEIARGYSRRPTSPFFLPEAAVMG